ncbi:MAG TPA: histidine kinase N-terminal 7TM domain-containing protein [Actinomycetales bacterium]|nr:histidine kinase N-terminal 7TM domain-containing protein [Actinomycetales bacterium]
MDDGIVPLGVALLAGAAAYVAVAAYVWTNRHAAAARALTVLTLAAGVWTLCYALEVSAQSRQQVELWGDLKYLGIVLVPPAMWAFALQYTGRRRRLRHRDVALLLVEPVVVLAALAVPATHDLVRSVSVSPDDVGQLVISSGPLFWAHLVYSYSLMLAATFVLVQGLLKVTDRHRWVAWSLIAVVLAPMVLNALYNLQVPGMDLVDLTPIAFSVTGLVLVWGLFRFRLLDLIPVGRKKIVDRIPDAVLVLDAVGRVVDVNPAGLALLRLPARRVTGRPAVDLLPALAGLLSAAAHGPVSGSCSLTSPDRSTVDVAVTVSPLPDEHHDPTGHLLVLRDVTVQRDVERRLRELVAERTETIAVLQRGLYPQRVPEVPGIDIAAQLSPAEAETNVGGDFVDIRATGPRRWTVIVGDVVGKGAGAATLTSLARHTTLALMSVGWSPSKVLAQVSQAIAADEPATPGAADPRFCTMALATLEPAAAPAAGADVVLALGGHPRPLLLRADGGVTEVGVPGTLLGIVDDPELHDVRLHLRPREALVLFTDGVTEARRGHEVFGEERLAALVGQLRGASASEIVARLVGAVRSFGGQDDPRDDVAVVAVVVPGAGEPASD